MRARCASCSGGRRPVRRVTRLPQPLVALGPSTPRPRGGASTSTWRRQSAGTVETMLPSAWRGRRRRHPHQAPGGRANVWTLHLQRQTVVAAAPVDRLICYRYSSPFVPPTPKLLLTIILAANAQWHRFDSKINTATVRCDCNTAVSPMNL